MAVYSKGKRARKKKLNIKKIICTILFLLIIISSIYFYINHRYWNTTNKDEKNTNERIEEQQETNVIENQSEIFDVSNIPEKMGEYDVLGQLVIEKIGLTKNILNISNNEALKLSVAKLYGPDLNEPGNFCIDGHNWSNMLKRLSEMQVGDTFYIIDRNAKEKINYKIYNTYTCVPEDISCLNQNDDEKKEITLITCTPGGAKRFICKARECDT